MNKILFFIITPFLCFSQSPDFQANNIRKHIKYLASDKLEGRGTGSEGEKLAAKYIIKQFKKAGLSPMGTNSSFLQQFTAKIKIDSANSRSVQAANVVGYLDNNAENTIIIGGHYDHLGIGNQGSSLDANPQGKIHNGADDNASGTAAVIELAKYYSKNNIKEKYNFLFICFSGEELGLYGSKYYAENPTIDLKKIDCMINMDMVGRYRDDKGLTVGGYGTSKTWGQIVPKIANNQLVKYNIDSAGVGPSDHTSFYLKNIPVMFLFTGPHSEYHKPGDDVELINTVGEAKVLSFLVSVVAQINELPKLDFIQTGNPHGSSNRSSFKVTMGIMPDYSFDKGGIKIDGVTKGRPAAIAGLEQGDILLRLGDIQISDIQVYMKALGSFKKGQTVEAEIKRGEEKKIFSITF